jgi:hypothetical protein
MVKFMNTLSRWYGVVETADRHTLGEAEKNRYNSRKLRFKAGSSKR